MSTRALRNLAPGVLLVTLAACDEIDRLRDRGRPGTPHEQYAAALHRAGLDQSALGRAWAAAARHAMVAPVPVTLPFSETAYFPISDARAVGYRVIARRGQRVVIDAERAQGSGARLFVDVFSVQPDGRTRSVRAGVVDSIPLSITRDSEDDTAYVIRVQPELLASARITLRVRVEPVLAFPLSGGSNRSVRSFWGAPRDGGRRSHQGVDIFAPRGTAVLAVAPGTISHVGTSQLGGNVVFLRDPHRRQNIYYAHLDSQFVHDGEQVMVGDTIGTVGTTGNARGGAPHLHFGIYRRGQGAIDPLHFIRREDDTPPALRADAVLLGELVRVTATGVDVLVAPGSREAVRRKLSAQTPMRIEGASADWYRVRLDDGLTGYVIARATESLADPIRTITLRPGDILRERPDSMAIEIATLDSLGAETAVPVVAAVRGFLLVRTESGATGWLPAR